MKKFTTQEIKEFISKPLFDELVLLKMTLYTSRAYASRFTNIQNIER